MLAMKPMLADILFEKKVKALNLVKMLDLGLLPDPDDGGRMTPISELSFHDFIGALALAANSKNLAKHSGAFSTAIIDFGDGPAECVIKLGNDVDRGFQYLELCKEKGGRSYCTGFPDIYYLDSFKINDLEPIRVAIMEYVEMSGIDYNVREDVSILLDDAKTKAFYKQDDLMRIGWTLEDTRRFFSALDSLGGANDIHTGNFGFRKDMSVCVFDPIA
jgi:hypothetical protein